MQRFSTRPLLNSSGKNSFIVRGSYDWDFSAPFSGAGHAQRAQRSFTRPKNMQKVALTCVVALHWLSACGVRQIFCKGIFDQNIDNCGLGNVGRERGCS